MRYTGLELFMEKLKNMIYSNDNPIITNHPSILSQRPQLKLVYEELDSMIQTLFTDQHHQLQQITDLQERFKDAAQEAHDIIDLFVSTINRSPPYVFCWGTCLPIRKIPFKKNVSLNLTDVVRLIQSIKEEFVTIDDKLKMDSLPLPSTGVAGTSCTKSPSGVKKDYEGIVVGFDRHVEVIRDKLVEDQKHLDVVSIVGMGGQGKTTLATKVFNDPFIMHHFHVRGWVVVSQTYEKKDLLIQILESISNKSENVRNHDYPKLRQMLHQKLMGQRYLIVIDDIWSVEAWDGLKLSFPDNQTGSRILLTSRLKEVASHVKSHGFIHQLEYLTIDESWELLCKKVFGANSVCPERLIKTGMLIAKNCHGLPLTLAVVGGILAKADVSKDSWERIGQSVSSYMVSDESDYSKQLALSVDHLPRHLRDCFLYLGGFPEDHRFRVQSLIWLWMAEGFIQREDEEKNLEEIGKDCLMELVDRNLVVVSDKKSNGDIKAFYVHDLLRELCLKIATQENFYLRAQHTTHPVEAYNQHRIFIEHDLSIENSKRIRTLVYVNRTRFSKSVHLWMLLTVLDLGYHELRYFPENISQLVHLRYLAISYNGDRKLPSSICKLWSLQTLIIRTDKDLELPDTITNLVNLRHLRCVGDGYSLFPAIQKPMNLQMIYGVILLNGVVSWVKWFPNIKKLSCEMQTYMECDLESLTSLENLNLHGVYRNVIEITELKCIRFPASLKSLSLFSCYIPWSCMSSLPNLEVLKLLHNSCMGPRWDVGEEQFPQLEVLILSLLDIKEWEASDVNFPCLKQLEVQWCEQLEEIPFDFGYIPTLELINIYACEDSVVESVQKIQEEQHAQGNFEMKFNVGRIWKYY